MWQYRARLVRVIDADTIVMDMDTGFGGRQEERLRLLDVSAPEIHEPGGMESRTFTEKWLINERTSGITWPYMVETDPTDVVEPTERRSLVRYLARVWHLGRGTPSLNYRLREYLAANPEWGAGR